MAASNDPTVARSSERDHARASRLLAKSSRRGLLGEGAPLAQITQLTGYASEASFSHAFRQWSGVAPGAYRKRSSQPSKPPPSTAKL